MDAIRPAVAADATACAAILNAWIDARDWMPRRHTPEEVEAFYRDVVFTQRSVWVTGRPVEGFLAMVPEDGWVTALYVAMPGRGIGRALLHFAKEGRARLYRREGFREVRRTAGENEEGLADVMLEWERGT